MTTHSRKVAWTLTLLAGASLYGAEVAEAKGPNINININFSVPRISPVSISPAIRPHIARLVPSDFAGEIQSNKKVKLTPQPESRRILTMRNITPEITGRPKRKKKPADAASPIVAHLPLRPPLQDKPTLPNSSLPPVAQGLIDGIITTGGNPAAWWQFQKWNDVVHGGLGGAAHGLLPGGSEPGDRFDPNNPPFGPKRVAGGDQGDVGPHGWPGSARGGTGLNDRSGEAGYDTMYEGRSRNGGSISFYRDKESGNDQTIWIGNRDGWQTQDAAESRSDGTTHRVETMQQDGRVRMRITDYSQERTTSNGVVVRDYTGLESTVGGFRSTQGTELIRNGPSAKGVTEDPVIQEPEPKPEDSQPVEEGTGRPRGGARSVRCDWWGCIDNGVSTPVRSNPGSSTNEGSSTVGSSRRTGPGAVTDPMPMDDATGRTGGGYNNPGPGGDPPPPQPH
jgi:hypothetical protein